MARSPSPRRLLRSDADDDQTRVTYFELFFDLVFVFAITEVSHIVLADPSWLHLGQALFVGVTVWWVWIYTAWITNWLHPDRWQVRAMLGALMMLGLLFAAAIPEAFGARAVLFAVTLVAINLGRSVFTAFAFGRRNLAEAINLIRISTWFAVTGVLWVTGGFVGEHARIVLWLVAFAIDVAGPRCFFWVPGLGPSHVDAWRVSGEHMAERVSLFLIIALGESVIVTGEGFGEHPLTAVNLVAFLAAFASTVLMWFLYFNHAQSFGRLFITRAAQTGLVAQVAYTYVPTLLVIGVVVSAMANGLVLEHPTGRTDGWTALLLNAGSAIYLLGNALFKRATGGQWLVSHLLGLAAFAVLFAIHPLVDAVVLTWLGNAVLLAIVLFDERAFRRWRDRQASLGG